MADRLLLVLAAALLLCCLATSPDDPPHRHYRSFSGRPGLLPTLVPNKDSVVVNSTQGWFEQRLDHLNAADSRTWQQRYWYHTKFYKAGGPVFLLLNGEGEAQPYWIEDDEVPWVQLAISHGAAIFLLEHRFYGQSRPLPDMSDQSLQYLSSVQAVEDIATFIKGMKTQLPTFTGGKWATFGGSYAASLAVWAREKHPEVVTAAVGSSAALEAEMDFTEYFEVVIAALQRSSPDCADSVRQGFQQVAQLSTTASGQNSLNNLFTICSRGLDWTNQLEVRNFWEAIYSVYATTVKLSGNNMRYYRDQLTTENAICRFHNNKTTNVLTRMKQVDDYYTEVFNAGCTYVNYTSLIEFLQDSSYGYAQNSRGWTWQTCTEFGFFQSTDSNTAGPYFGGKDKLPVDYYIKECADVFGTQYNSLSIGQAVQKTNQYYGGKANLTGTNIALLNGNVDPCNPLGKMTSDKPKEIVPIVIDGLYFIYPSRNTLDFTPEFYSGRRRCSQSRVIFSRVEKLAYSFCTVIGVHFGPLFILDFGASSWTVWTVLLVYWDKIATCGIVIGLIL